MLRLFPVAADQQHPVTAEDAYGDLELARRAPGDRPYLIVNMVATADGQGRIGANTDDLGNAADMALFLQLREQVDCVMAGTRTIEAEQYKGPASQPTTRDRRERRGLRPRPLLATVTRSGYLPLDAPCFRDPDLEIAVFCPTAPATGDSLARIAHVPVQEPREILRELHERFGVRSVLLEGGPNLNAPFFAAELVDELFLTVAPVLTGSGESFPIIGGLLPRAQKLHLVSALAEDEHLFLRYRVD